MQNARETKIGESRRERDVKIDRLKEENGERQEEKQKGRKERDKKLKEKRKIEKQREREREGGVLFFFKENIVFILLFIIKSKSATGSLCINNE